MSIRLMAEAWTLDLTHSQTMILLAICDHARDDGTSAYPGIEYLAWKTHYSERQVRRIIRELERLGLIEPVAFVYGGRGRATEFHVHIEKGVTKAPFVPGTSRSEKADNGDNSPGPVVLERRTFDASKGVAVTPQPPVTINEPLKENHQESSDWLDTLRSIPGWDERGKPHEPGLMSWVQRQITDLESDVDRVVLETSAEALASAKEKTLKGYGNMAMAYRKAVRGRWGGPNDGQRFDNGERPQGGDREGAAEPTPAPMPETTAKVGPVDRGDDGVWDQVKALIKPQVTRPAFATHLANTIGLGYSGQTLVVEVPLRGDVNQLQGLWWHFVRKALREIMGGADNAPPVEYVVSESAE